MSRNDLTPEEHQFIEHWGHAAQQTIEGMPSPTKAALVTGAAFAGLGALLGRKPLKWGLWSGGVMFATMLVAEVSFAFGTGAGMLVAVQECERSFKTGRPVAFSTSGRFVARG
jgi:hypothetical protein